MKAETKELFPRVGENHAPYLIDGSGCVKCNFTGRFGGWIAGRWHGYPQIRCEHCSSAGGSK